MAEKRIGRISVDLLGSIAKELGSLRGIPVMAYELIQNAEDSGATECVFNINDDGIELILNSTFTKCSDRESETCAGLHGNTQFGCNWHNIRNIAAGQKAENEPDAIGRFGIGFLSVYQVTDTPIISSDGLTLRFDPGNRFESVVFDDSEVIDQTVIQLPWAFDQNSEARRRFHTAPIMKVADFNGYAEDFGNAADEALLFLTKLKRIEVNRNGNRIHSVEVHDKPKNVREIVLGPRTIRQNWYRITDKNVNQLQAIEEKNAIIKRQNRKHLVDIAIPISGVSHGQGRLYAFLPTDETFQLPIRINGDFFPDPSRKRILFTESFADDGNVQWNHAIIASAAELLAKNISTLKDILDPDQFWRLVSGAREMSARLNDVGSDRPKSYGEFWDWIKGEIGKYPVVPCEGNVRKKISESLIVHEPNLGLKRLVATDLGLYPVASNMKSHLVILAELGAPTFDLHSLISAAQTCKWVLNSSSEISAGLVESRYRPLWEVLDGMLSAHKDLEDNPSIPILRALPIFLSDRLLPVNLDDHVLLEKATLTETARAIFPDISFLSFDIFSYKSIRGVSKVFDLAYVLECLEEILNIQSLHQSKLYDLYNLLNDISYSRVILLPEKENLRGLQIWPTTDGSYVNGQQAVIPGDFTDPLGVANLLDVKRINKSGQNLLEKTLEVSRLTVESYVLDVLPQKFQESKIEISS